jgi:repressor LexA
MVTAKQKKVLEFISEFSEENGYIPTLQAIAKGLNVKSPSTIHQHVRELIKKGYLGQRDDYGALEINTGITIKNNVPIIGIIAAGSPILALENETTQTLTVDNLPENSEFFALKVSGDSMIEDGIFDGDTVVIKRQNYANDGQTVVAIIDTEENL